MEIENIKKVLNKAKNQKEISFKEFGFALYVLDTVKECPKCSGYGVLKEKHGEEFKCNECNGHAIIIGV